MKSTDSFNSTDSLKSIDLRSDTVTRPSAGMRAAMAAAEVGDDVMGDDPTVNALQDRAAALFNYGSALFVPSGTQSNLLALMTHCDRGDEFIAGQEAHLYKYETGGAAVLGSIQPQPIAHDADGTLALENILRAIKADDVHFSRTRLLALENTWQGRVLSLDYVASATALAHQKGLSTHLDGARVVHAATKLGISFPAAVHGFDSLSFCLSKGLGAPVGSLLCGTAEFIGRARRWRKMLGGGMRQAGILAAAGLYALDHNVQRLQEDHDNATRLASGLADITQITVQQPQTNMVYVQIPEPDCSDLGVFLRQRGIYAGIGPVTRLVTHMDVTTAHIDETIAAFKDFYSEAFSRKARRVNQVGPV
ncbi:low-specificity L-threonine aldolase [Allopusillimonas ginsengisoli]|uniref:low-specificity L-threonine aldolase n=1 Tax=Allopusillimonas ginsengisoli TaxID=453575 RepID=UPI0039C10055